MTIDAEQKKPLETSDLEELVEGAKALSEGKYDREINTVLKGELSSLARYINETRKMLAGMRPELSYAADSLPNAFDTLQDICDTTEVATHNILSIVENLLDTDDELDASVQVVSKYLEENGTQPTIDAMQKLEQAHTDRSAALTELMTLLSFQDLTSQTIVKIGKMINEVEERILSLLVTLGEPTGETESGKVHLSGLERLKESQEGVSKQNLVDELLKQFG